MIIDLNGIEEKALENFYGGEGIYNARIYADQEYKIIKGRLEPGASIGLHLHENGAEIIHILSGRGKAIYNDGFERVEPGSVHYCERGKTHSLINDGVEDLVFFAVVDL